MFMIDDERLIYIKRQVLKAGGHQFIKLEGIVCSPCLTFIRFMR